MRDRRGSHVEYHVLLRRGFFERAEDGGDAPLAGERAGAFPVEVEQAGHGKARLAIGGKVRVPGDSARAEDHDRARRRGHRPLLLEIGDHASASTRAWARARRSAVGASVVVASVSRSSTMCERAASLGVSGSSRAYSCSQPRR